MSLEIQGPQTDVTEAAEERRLDSWKEIAAFFQRDTRTVRRWEQTRQLPVRRVPGRRGYVFAYVEELNQWLRSSASMPDEDELSLPPLDPVSREVGIAEKVDLPRASVVTVASRSHHGWILAAAVLALFLATIVAAVRYRRRPAKVSAAAPIVTPSDLSESAKYTLRGRFFWDRRTEGGLQEALDAYTQAVVHDNNNARAYAGLAETYDLLPEYGKMRNSDAFPRAIAAANRAISLDPSLAEAHRALAFALFYWNWDVNRSLNEYRLALQLDPLDFESHHWLATTFLTLGRGSESRAEIQRARELQPASRSILADQALINFYFHSDRSESIATLREIERTDPDFVTAPRYLADIFRDEKNYGEYLAEATRAAAIVHDTNGEAVMQAASIGWRKDGDQGMLLQMKQAQEKQFGRGEISGFEVARTCADLGDKAAAVRYLQAGFADHDYMLLTVLDGKISSEMAGYPEFAQLQAAIRSRMNQHNE